MISNQLITLLIEKKNSRKDQYKVIPKSIWAFKCINNEFIAKYQTKQHLF